MISRRRVVLSAMAVVLALVGVLWAIWLRTPAPPHFPSLDPRPVPWPTAEDELCASRPVVRDPALPPWSWPGPAVFAAARERVKQAGPLPVLFGTLTMPDEPSCVALPVALSFMRWTDQQGAKRTFLLIEALHVPPGDARLQSLRHLVIGQGAASTATDLADVKTIPLKLYWPPTEGNALVVDVRVAPPRALAPELAALRGYVDAVLGDHPGDVDIPVGRCSHDSTPETAANAEFERTIATGEMGRFVRLHWKVAGGLPRISFSTPNPIPPIRACALTDAPLDLAAFFAGSCVACAGDSYNDPLVPDDPLGARIARAGLGDALGPWLRRNAEDESLDAFNRLRMARILAAVLAHGPGEPPLTIASTWSRPAELVLPRLEPLRLSDPARWWFGFH